MTLVVEDGSGLSNAEAYVSAADADSYFIDMGETDWTGDTAIKEAAIRKATVYLDTMYVYKGTITSTTQSLCWPRQDVVDKEDRDIADDIVPQTIINACCELALCALSGRLISELDKSNFTKREKVDVIEVEYFSGAPINRTFPHVDLLVQGLILNKSGGSSIGLVRV